MNIYYRVLFLVFCFICIVGFEIQDKKSRAEFEKLGYIVWEVKTEQKRMALTFDDGPAELYTEEILELLKLYNAKATFFVVGRKVNDNPALLKRAFDEGHEIGNHTYKHLMLDNRTSLQTLEKEIVETGDAIKQIIGYTPKLYRPPGGLYTDKSIEMTQKLGYTTILWSWHQDTNDWRHPGVSKIANKVIKNAHNGDIVLLHDFNPGTNQTVEALKIILPALINEGYELVTVSELMEDTRSEFRDVP